MSRCEDYPCCGHTNDDPCERQPYDEPGYFDTTIRGNEHALCEHEFGFCDVEPDDDECDPYAGYCANDDDDCTSCQEFWIDFHADGMAEDAAMETGLWGSEA